MPISTRTWKCSVRSDRHGLVRPRSAPADCGAPAGSQAGSGRIRSAARARLCRSLPELGNARLDRIARAWSAREVLPLIVARRPEARLVVAGSDPPPAHAYADLYQNLEMLG